MCVLGVAQTQLGYGDIAKGITDARSSAFDKLTRSPSRAVTAHSVSRLNTAHGYSAGSVPGSSAYNAGNTSSYPYTQGISSDGRNSTFTLPASLGTQGFAVAPTFSNGGSSAVQRGSSAMAVSFRAGTGTGNGSKAEHHAPGNVSDSFGVKDDSFSKLSTAGVDKRTRAVRAQYTYCSRL